MLLSILLSAVSKFDWVQIGLAVALLLVVSVIWRRFLKRCSSCGKWNALYESDRVFDEYKWRKKIYKTTHKDSKGRVTGTTEREGRERYRMDKVTIECRNCDSAYTRRYEEGKHIGDGGISLFVTGLIIIGIYSFIGHVGSAKPNQNNSSTTNEQLKNNNTNKPDPPPKINRSVNDIDSSPRHQESASPDSNSIVAKTVTIPKEAPQITKESIDREESPLRNVTSEQNITEETPENIRVELAKSMLERGKSVDEVEDSTYLTKRQIRKIRRRSE